MTVTVTVIGLTGKFWPGTRDPWLANRDSWHSHSYGHGTFIFRDTWPVTSHRWTVTLVMGCLFKSKGDDKWIKSIKRRCVIKRSCVKRETKPYRYMSREYKGERHGTVHTWTNTIYGHNQKQNRSCYRTRAYTQKHMQHTDTVCGIEGDLCILCVLCVWIYFP